MGSESTRLPEDVARGVAGKLEDSTSSGAVCSTMALVVSTHSTIGSRAVSVSGTYSACIATGSGAWQMIGGDGWAMARGSARHSDSTRSSKEDPEWNDGNI